MKMDRLQLHTYNLGIANLGNDTNHEDGFHIRIVDNFNAQRLNNILTKATIIIVQNTYIYLC